MLHASAGGRRRWPIRALYTTMEARSTTGRRTLGAHGIVACDRTHLVSNRDGSPGRAPAGFIGGVGGWVLPGLRMLFREHRYIPWPEAGRSVGTDRCRFSAVIKPSQERARRGNDYPAPRSRRGRQAAQPQPVPPPKTTPSRAINIHGWTGGRRAVRSQAGSNNSRLSASSMSLRTASDRVMSPAAAFSAIWSGC